MAEVGLDPTAIKTVLKDSRASDHYDKAIKEAFQRGIKVFIENSLYMLILIQILMVSLTLRFTWPPTL